MFVIPYAILSAAGGTLLVLVKAGISKFLSVVPIASIDLSSLTTLKNALV